MQYDHAWQELGFIPPYRLVGFYAIPSPALAEANPNAYQRQLSEMPKGCGIGSCSVCTTPLVNNYILKDARGVRFAVGCDCVQKQGSSSLISDVQAHKNRIAREVRAAKREEQRRAKYEYYLAELESQRTRNGGLTDDELEAQHREQAARNRHNAITDLLAPLAHILNQQNGDFCRSVTRLLNNGDVKALSTRMIDIVDQICQRNGLEGAAKIIDRARSI
ncbi:hypothetical protein [Cellvibrio sp. QJXJ]|uniref:hypothetical protein n=1 Tax=Cellvibrio sp. QJXJ TaxID=2964606 RepID=UPI0021C26EE2|nr:hypothetical protein [Cellvibrio sp. QJXJ]UUA75154.1 hypothetical protein NNX04_22110 [Cellvibrio sp. QJXJ]